MAPDKQRPKAGRVTEDTFASVIRDYMRSPKWILPQDQGGYSDETKRLFTSQLNLAARPECLGAVQRADMRPALVQAFLDGLAGRPGKQQASLAVLRLVEKWAIVRDLITRPITLGVQTERPQGGHVPWTDDQVALAELHARPDIARFITLGVNTGQRGSDLIRMCWTDIEEYEGTRGIKVTQKKTGREVWIPIGTVLAAAMATWERRPGPFLLRQDGRPWTRKGFQLAWDAHRESNPALAALREAALGYKLVPHGLRGTACVRLRRAGATPAQIADTVGMSEPMVARYCRLSLQKENALAAVYHLERTHGERKVVKAIDRA